ncbi:hypothetical protein EYE40_02170 [Glaciihabitans arcticus]|uniref:Endonuclease GajA/Old nuclease/RecF-like AAA domain-containing protein n=1 Tax=Glaciihabitans arcticus TaxID=2668039 RepID=A0A4Q9GNK3_9MICO|nr:AAA family ATPase [Glaciihabitans arcticus]TBN56296.1 hypothetical protein EYE40_02170 [Glaciihabitans arcticus]
MRVSNLSVTGVLGQYDHHLDLPGSGDFAIVYGPNGVGKTKFLEAIDGLMRLDTAQLTQLPFDRAHIVFDDGSHFSVSRSGKFSSLNVETIYELRFVLERRGNRPIHWVTDDRGIAQFERFLRTETTWSPIAGTTEWQDNADGEIADFVDLQRRFSSGRSLTDAKMARPMPDGLSDFSAELQSHLIETQRLRIEEYSAGRDRAMGRNGRQRRPISTIVNYANRTKKLLSEALAENSKITQQLDRTFPNRMLGQEERPAINENEIRQKYDLQDRFRSRLAQIALIGLEPELSLPKRKLSPFEIAMLDLYLRDADRKLESFEELLARIELFEDIVNTRFLRKILHVNADDGLAVTSTEDGSTIDLDSLSSGEQHEIILMYGLLFNVKAGSLVLIDEPEISLHVSWQLSFVSDVARIAKLSGFQFIVATHSPQVINNWWTNAKQLGPENAEFQ